MGINNVSSLEGDMFEEKLKSSKPIEDFTSVRKTKELETYQKLITGELTYNDHSHIMDELYCSIITAFKEHLKRIGTYGYDGYHMYGYNGERTYEIPSGDSVMKVRINHSQYNHHRMNIFINNHKLSIINISEKDEPIFIIIRHKHIESTNGFVLAAKCFCDTHNIDYMEIE